MSASKKKKMGSQRRSLNTNVQETPEVSGTAKSPPEAQSKDTKAVLSLSPDSAAQSEIPVRKKKLGSQRATSKGKQQFKDFTTTGSSHKPTEEVGGSTTNLPSPVSNEMDILDFESESLQKVDESLKTTDTSIAQKSDLLSDESLNIDMSSPEMQPISIKSHGSGFEDSDVTAGSDWLLSNVQSKKYLPEIERAQEGVLSEKQQGKEKQGIPEASFATGVTGESTSSLKLIEREEISDSGSHETNTKHSEVGHPTEKPVCQETSENTVQPVASIRKLGSSRGKKEKKKEQLQDEGEEANAVNVLEKEIANVQNSPKEISLGFLGDVAFDKGQLVVHSPRDINKDDGLSVVVETNINSDKPQVEDAPVASSQTAGDSQLRRKLGSSRRMKVRGQDNDEAKEDEKSDKENIPDKIKVEPVPREQSPETIAVNIFNESVGGQEVDEGFIKHSDTQEHVDDSIEGNITTDNSISVKAVVQEPTVQSDPFQNIFNEWEATAMSHPHHGTLIQVSQESESVNPFATFSPPNDQVNMHQITFLDDSDMENSSIKTDEASQLHQVEEGDMIQSNLTFKYILEDKNESEDITTDQIFKTGEITSSFGEVQEQPLLRPVKHVTFQKDDNHNFDEGFLAANTEYNNESFGGSRLPHETTGEEEVKSALTEVIFSKEETVTEPGLQISTEKHFDSDESEDYDLLNISKSPMSEEALNKSEVKAAETEDVHQIASPSEGVSEDGKSAEPKETSDEIQNFEFLNLESSPDTDRTDSAPDIKLDAQQISSQTDITASVENVATVDSQLTGHRRKLGSSRKIKGRRQANDESKQDERSEEVNTPDKASESALEAHGTETAVNTGRLDEQTEVTERSVQSVHEKSLETVDFIQSDKKLESDIFVDLGSEQANKTPQEHPDSVVFERSEEDAKLCEELLKDDMDGYLFPLKTIETTALHKEDQEEEVKLSDEEPSEADKTITLDTNALQASPQTLNTGSVEDVSDMDPKKINDESNQGEILEEFNIPDRTIETTQTDFVIEKQGPAMDIGVFDKQESGQEGDDSFVEVHDESFVVLTDTSLEIADMTAVFEEQQQKKGKEVSEQVTHDKPDIAKKPNEPELSTDKTKVDSQPKIHLKPKEKINVHQITFLSDNDMSEDMDTSTAQPGHDESIGELSETVQTEIEALDSDPHHGPGRRKLGSSRRIKDRKPASDVVIDLSENGSTSNVDISSSENKGDADITQLNPQEGYGLNLAKQVLTEAIKEENIVKPQDTESVKASENVTVHEKQEYFSSSDKEQTTDSEPYNQNVPHQEAINISTNEYGFDQEKDTKVQIVLPNDKQINEETQKKDPLMEDKSFTSINLKENVDAGAEHGAVVIDSAELQNKTTPESEEVVRDDLFDAIQIGAMSHADDIAKDQQVTQDMEFLEAAGAKLQIASEQKRKKMGSTRRSQLHKKQDEERNIETEDIGVVFEKPTVTDEVIATENNDAKVLQKDTFEKQQENIMATNTITVELHSQEGKEIPELVQEGVSKEFVSFVDIGATQNLQLVSGDEIQPSSPGKRRKMGSTRKNLISKQESPQDDQGKYAGAENVENIAVLTITEENTEGKDSGLLLHAVPTQQNDDEIDLGQQPSKAMLNSEFPSQEADMSSKSDAMTEEALVTRRRKMGSHRKPHTDEVNKQDVYNERATEESIIQPLREHKVDSSKVDPQVKGSSNTAMPAAGAFDIKVEPMSQKPSQQPLLSSNVRVAPESRIRLSSGHRASLGSSRFEVVMIGDSSVGKTSFMKRAQSGKFSLDLPASVGLDSYIWTVMVEGKPVALHLWDTAGQERFHSMTKQIFHRAQAFLLMYDVSCGQSFAAVSYWANCIKEGAAENVVILLLGNKSDCKDRRVARDDGEFLAQEHNFAFMECSAATGENVMEALETVARLLNQRAAARREEPLMLRKPESRKKPGCC